MRCVEAPRGMLHLQRGRIRFAPGAATSEVTSQTETTRH